MYLKYLVWTKTITCIFHKILKNFSFTGTLIIPYIGSPADQVDGAGISLRPVLY